MPMGLGAAIEDEMETDEEMVAIPYKMTTPHERILEAMVERLSYGDLVFLTKELINRHYPAAVFDGSSGDVGSVLVAEVRKLCAHYERSRRSGRE